MRGDAQHEQNPSSRESKAELRRRLPLLIEASSTGGAAAVEALRACCTVGKRPPRELLSSETLASLSADDLVRMLPKLGTTEKSLDYAAVLDAIRAKVSVVAPTGLSLNSLSKQIINRLNKLGGNPDRKKRRSGIDEHYSQNRFTSPSVHAVVGLAEVLMKAGKGAWDAKRGSESASRLAILWFGALEAIVSEDSDLDVVASVLTLWRRAASLLPSGAQIRVSGNEWLRSYIARLRSAVLKSIEPALLNGRIDQLQLFLKLADADPEMRSSIRTSLRDSGTRLVLELPAGVREWIANSLEEGRKATKEGPKPADESQSAVVETVAVCLLSAWDGTTDPSRARSALNAFQSLAHDLFKVNLIGEVGELAKFDARRHDGGGTVFEDGAMVRITRPGVVWSDGLRSRIIIRASVEGTGKETSA